MGDEAGKKYESENWRMVEGLECFETEVDFQPPEVTYKRIREDAGQPSSSRVVILDVEANCG